MLVIENVVVVILGGLRGWLPGAAVRPPRRGQQRDGHGRALALALAYALGALLVSVAVFCA